MLELRPNCECCNTDLPPSSAEAFICTFECTFCASCTESKLRFKCPNCGGDLVCRPVTASAFASQVPGLTAARVQARWLL
jgi:hypothetical protein